MPKNSNLNFSAKNQDINWENEIGKILNFYPFLARKFKLFFFHFEKVQFSRQRDTILYFITFSDSKLIHYETCPKINKKIR